MDIGVYGGTFDPIHRGHRLVAEYVALHAGLNSVWFMVSPLNPLKEGTHPASFADRLAMARLVARKSPLTEASGFESKLDSPYYSYRTLRALRNSYPSHRFHLVIGADNLRDLSLWRNPDEIAAEFGIIVFPRPGISTESLSIPPGVMLLSGTPLADVSSTEIRKALAEGRETSQWLDRDVEEYIITHNLYTPQK